MDFVHVADCAYPQDWVILPDNVTVVLGYIGQDGATPHVWTMADIQTVEDAGLLWGAIWTPPQAGFDPNVGAAAGNGMVAALERISYPVAAPVFLDIEQHTYATDPHTVLAGVAAWQHAIAARQTGQAIPYLPAAAQRGWIADWVGVAPVRLAAGVVGVQYAGRLAGDRYDLSVVDPAALAGLAHFTRGNVMTFDKDEINWLQTNVVSKITNLHAALDRMYSDHDTAAPRPYAMRHIKADTAAILADLAKSATASVDTAKVAAAIAADLKATLGTDVAAELGKRLTNG